MAPPPGGVGPPGQSPTAGRRDLRGEDRRAHQGGEVGQAAMCEEGTLEGL